MCRKAAPVVRHSDLPQPLHVRGDHDERVHLPVQPDAAGAKCKYVYIYIYILYIICVFIYTYVYISLSLYIYIYTIVDMRDLLGWRGTRLAQNTLTYMRLA